MPLLAKQEPAVPALADAETEQSPCEKLATQPQTSGNDGPDWIRQVKNSPWLPWAVAGGFALLWMNKGK